MNPTLRKIALTAHVTCAVGWLGVVAAFLALAIVGLTSDDPDTVRGVYLVMEPMAGLILVPLGVLSLVTGLVQSLITPWGLIRHYWVVFKLLINVIALVVLIMYLETFRTMADVAADAMVELGEVRNSSPALHAGAALVLLLVATVLSVHKPRGLTPYGWRGIQERRTHLTRKSGA